jgi:sugar/nucleoside kinase (ribokinase family)
MGMIDSGLVDTLFGNEHEVQHLTGCRGLADCLDALSSKVGTLVVTRGAEGAVSIEGGQRFDAPAAAVERVVDTTGAGDLFAAGFMAARCRGRELRECLEAGAIAAAEVISHFGARPEANLKELVAL